MAEIQWPVSLWICPNGHRFTDAGTGRCGTCRRQLGLVHVERLGRVVELEARVAELEAALRRHRRTIENAGDVAAADSVSAQRAALKHIADETLWTEIPPAEKGEQAK